MNRRDFLKDTACTGCLGLLGGCALFRDDLYYRFGGNVHRDFHASILDGYNYIKDNYGMEAVPVILAVCAVVAAVIAIAKSAAKKRGDGAKPAPAPVRKTPSVDLHRPVPSVHRREPVTAQRQFPQPEAYCVSCELSGEDHFVRDRKRRLAQLDEWLKNGLVDKEEYRVLKYRFERDQ